ncbi:hypothetical protein C8R43DRAFT_910814 [Mycena crocata]|nr:hypothetical protein C8R43DRAFT_910814 [Mycena crocata]
MAKKLGHFARKMDDYDRLFMAIATNDVPRIHAFFRTGLKNGTSTRALLEQFYLAVEGMRSTKGFSNFEYDIMTLVYRVGGRSLVYALNHALNLPSLRSLCNHANFVKIKPTIGPISDKEILANINEVILKPRAAAGITKKRGATVMMDEVGMEEAAVYFPHENAVGGLCQKHSNAETSKLRSYQSALRIVKDLADGSVHFGKEMAVVAVRLSNELDVYPILAAPTCKQETRVDMEDLFNKLIDLWGASEAQRIIGEIWTFATDGDPLRRAAGHNVFCNIPLDPTSALHQIIADCLGLNLFTGPQCITLTFDWHHILKRKPSHRKVDVPVSDSTLGDCTLLRQMMGMTVDGRIINPVNLAKCLKLLEGQDDASVHKLLNPDDAQDVPRAIQLLEAIISVRNVVAPSREIELASDIDSVTLLGHVFEPLLAAFVDPTMSTSQQIEKLSTYAHLSFVFFRKYRLKFMSNQLYGDTQTMIKNVIFSTAKQQLLDDNDKANANQDGTDPLEGHFSQLRDVGGQSAFNYKQGIERCGWACDIQCVYSRNPELHAGHRRRKITRVEHKDHLHPDDWTGDTVSGHSDIPASYFSGAEIARGILRKHSKLPPEDYDFEKIFNDPADPTIDLLRPWGKDKYPGIEGDADRSALTPSSTTTSSTTNPASNSTPVEPPVTSIPSAPSTSELPASQFHAATASPENDITAPTESSELTEDEPTTN